MKRMKDIRTRHGGIRLTFSLLLIAVVLFIGAAIAGTSAVYADEQDITENISKDVYKSLGLSIDTSQDYVDKTVNELLPYSTGKSQFKVANEVYVATSGRTDHSKWRLFDGWKNLKLDTSQYKNGASSSENMYNTFTFNNTKYYNYFTQAYQYYGSSGTRGGNPGISIMFDDGWNSLLKHAALDGSDGTKDNITGGDDTFTGAYATSVAFNGGDGKDNYIAELRAYKEKNALTTYDGTKYNGGIYIQVYKLDDDGNRTTVARLDPTLTEGHFHYAGSSSYKMMTYLYYSYQQELESLFEVEAADTDGDGYDELYVYSGGFTGTTKDSSLHRYAVVDRFTTSDGKTFTKKDALSVDAGLAQNYVSTGSVVNEIPAVTLAAGDLGRDLKEELAVGVSRSKSGQAKGEASAWLTVYGYDTSKKDIEALSGFNDLPIGGEDDTGTGVFGLNVAFGDFTLSTTGVSTTVLFAAGYNRSDTTKAIYRTTYLLDGKYQTSDSASFSLGAVGNEIVKSNTNTKHADYDAYLHWAPLALACADTQGSLTSDAKNERVLVGGDIYTYNIANGFSGSQIGHISLYGSESGSNEMPNKNHAFKELGQKWIGDIAVGTVDNNPNTDANAWRETFVCVVGQHRNEKSKGSDDYCWLNLSMAWSNGSKIDSVMEGVVCESQSRHNNETTGTYLSLALPDIGNDSITLEYQSAGLVYTDPEICAVLQAGPYYTDLQKTYGYASDGTTSIGKSESSAHGNGVSIGGDIGCFFNLNTSAAISISLSAEISGQASGSFQGSKTKSYTQTYTNNAGGDDLAVIYTIPYARYYYKMTSTVIDKETGKEKTISEDIAIETPLAAAVTTIEVSDYDEIAEETEDLTTIRGNLIDNKPGNPLSYSTQDGGSGGIGSDLTADDLKYSYGEHFLTGHTDTGSAGQTITITNEDDWTFNGGVKGGIGIGGGPGAVGNEVIFGVKFNYDILYSHTYTTTNGGEFSATVMDMPKSATEYGFKWQMNVYSKDLGEGDEKNEAWIVTYDLEDVQNPLAIPCNLKVSAATSDSLTLSWDAVDNALYYKLYEYNANGENRWIADVYGTSYTDDADGEGLFANTSYSYVVQAVGNANGGGRRYSLESTPASGKTLQQGATFRITQQPSDITVKEGSSDAKFSVAAEFIDADGNSRTPSYQWQVDEGSGSFTNIKEGGNSSTYTVPVADVTKENSGWVYRCVVSYSGGYSLYSDEAQLRVSDKEAAETTPSVSWEEQTGGTLSATRTPEGGEADELKSGTKLSYGCTDTLTFTAVPDVGYVVDKLTVNGKEVTGIAISGTDNQVYSYKPEGGITDDVTIKVTYKKLGTKAVDWSVKDTNSDGKADGGKLKVQATRSDMDAYDDPADDKVTEQTSGNSTVHEGGELTLIAVPDGGYRVKQWKINGEVYKNGDTTVVDSWIELSYGVLENEADIEVEYEKGDARISYHQPLRGSLTAKTSAGEEFTSGGSTTETLTFTASPKTRYEVKKWLVIEDGKITEQVDGAGQLITTESLTFTPTIGKSAHVMVVMQGCELSLTIEVTPDGAGTVTGLPDTVRYGDEITLVALANDGYSFDAWLCDGKKIDGAAASYSFTAEKSGKYTARFSDIAEPVTFTAVPVGAGTVNATADGQFISSGDEFTVGTKLVFTAYPAEGYQVAKWSDNVTVDKDNPNIATATMGTEPLEVSATFEGISRTVTILLPENGTITAVTADGTELKSGDEVPYGTEVTFTAVANSGYKFASWTEDAYGHSGESFTMEITNDYIVGALFTAEGGGDPGGGGSEDNDKNGQQGTAAESGKPSGTGDETQLIFWIALVAATLCGTGGAVLYRRKKS